MGEAPHTAGASARDAGRSAASTDDGAGKRVWNGASLKVRFLLFVPPLDRLNG